MQSGYVSLSSVISRPSLISFCSHGVRPGPVHLPLSLTCILVGFDTGNKTYTAIGDPKARLSFTSKSDIGRAIAELSLLSLGPSANTVPDRVRIAGDTVSIEGVATALRKVRKELGIDDIEIAIKSEDLDAFRIKTKERQLANPKSDPVWHIR